MDTRQKDGADFPSVRTSHLEHQPKNFRFPNLLSSHVAGFHSFCKSGNYGLLDSTRLTPLLQVDAVLNQINIQLKQNH